MTGNEHRLPKKTKKREKQQKQSLLKQKRSKVQEFKHDTT
jgi:hypothetical protein